MSPTAHCGEGVPGGTAMVNVADMGAAVRTRGKHIGGQEVLMERDKAWFMARCVAVKVQFPARKSVPS